MKQQRKWGMFLKQLALSLVCTILLFCLIHMLAYRRPAQKQQEAEAYLTQLEQADLAGIQALIEEADLRIALANAPNNTEKNKLRFGNSVILGDSIVEGLVDYRLLNPTQAISERGRRSDNCGDDIKKAASLSPKRVILHYGMNDLEYCGGNEKLFIDHYQKVIKQVKQQMPKAKIYIHAILPVDSTAIARVNAYAKWRQFNQELKKLCQKEGITFIDGGFLLKTKADYEADGIHPKFAFYEKWLPYLLEVLQ